VEWLSTCAASFRRAAALQFPSYEGFLRYSSYDDLEMTYRMSRRYRLLLTPHARVEHLKAPGGRVGGRDLAYRQIVDSWYHFDKNMPHRLVNRLAYAWMVLGTLTADLAAVLLMPHRFGEHRLYLAGHAAGVRDCLLHQAHRRLPEWLMK
jgi:hypothetical protein